MAVVVSLNLQGCVTLYQRLYRDPVGPRADVLRRRLSWRLTRLSPKEQDRYYALILAWRLDYETPKPDPGLSWEGVR